MIEIPAYPSPVQAKSKEARALWGVECFVQEKVDGSQFSFARFEDGVKCRSRGQAIDLSAPHMFEAGVKTVADIAERLIPGAVYRGEYLQRPRHNRLVYGRVPKGHIALFDITWPSGEHATMDGLQAAAESLGLEAVPVIAPSIYRTSFGFEEIQSWFANPSFLGGPMEGVVVKPVSSQRQHLPTVKIVSEAFKEFRAPHQPNKAPDIIATLAAECRSLARLEKAVQHLREAGTLTNTSQDIGPIIRELQADLLENETELQQAVWAWALPRLQKALGAGVADWYIQTLGEDSNVKREVQSD